MSWVEPFCCDATDVGELFLTDHAKVEEIGFSSLIMRVLAFVTEAEVVSERNFSVK